MIIIDRHGNRRRMTLLEQEMRFSNRRPETPLPRDREPTHPGEFVRLEFLEPEGITQKAFAKALDISLVRANEILNGKRRVSPDTAVRLGIALGTSPDVWLRMQAARDLWELQRGHVRKGFAKGVKSFRKVKQLVNAPMGDPPVVFDAVAPLD
ncbi:MAG TPA: HigA family addiction module antitoxin [Candidatus Rubrimentiphilum sp.]|nr:HigA family addiction module antitoxin [Candidatus Rubrimentiphilum sp.]